jgi:hypothetical protein
MNALHSIERPASSPAEGAGDIPVARGDASSRTPGNFEMAQANIISM